MRLGILLPVYNDWESLEKVLGKIREELLPHDCTFIIINDASDQEMPSSLTAAEDVFIVNLARNLGHQKAIAIGLGWAARNFPCDAICVMDSDGEDSPEDIRRLIEEYEKTGQIVFASRRSRKETVSFKILYLIYKLIFRLAVGKPINFGNFSIIPSSELKKIIYVSEIWNHYPGGVIRSKLPFSSVPADRAPRTAGKSKMGIVNLIIHGLSSLTVNLDIITVRFILFAFVSALLLVLTLLAVIFIRFFTDMAVPGWATYTIIGIFIIITQSILIALTLSLNVLSARSLAVFIPAHDFERYIFSVKEPGQADEHGDKLRTG